MHNSQHLVHNKKKIKRPKKKQQDIAYNQGEMEKTYPTKQLQGGPDIRVNKDFSTMIVNVFKGHTENMFKKSKENTVSMNTEREMENI
jgi:hypothetical protein